MPRRLREYLDRLSHRDIHREESNTYTVNTTVNMNDWARWNTTQWFPNNEDTTARVHDMDISGLTRQMLDNAYNNITAREAMETASATTSEDMLRMVRVVPNIDYLGNVIEEQPMDPPPQRHSLYIHDMDDVAMYREYTPYWNSNRTIAWNWANNLSGHVEYRRGKIIRIKRYCKI